MADLNFSQIKEQLLLLFYKLAMEGLGSSISWPDERDIRLPGVDDDFLVEQARLGLIEDDLLSFEVLNGLHLTAKGLSRSEELLSDTRSLFYRWSNDYDLHWHEKKNQGQKDGASMWTLRLVPSDDSAEGVRGPNANREADVAWSSSAKIFSSEEFDRLDWLILGALLERAHESKDGGELSEEQIHEMAQVRAPNNAVLNALEELRRFGLLRSWLFEEDSGTEPVTPPVRCYRITPRGIYLTLNRSHDVMESAHGLTFDYPDEIGDSLAEILFLDDDLTDEKRTTELGKVAFSAPAADRVVPLNHNSAEYQNATEALDELIELVRSDNEYGSRAPEEKEQLVASLTAGRRLLNGVTVRLSAAYAILLPPLRYVADNFGKGVITAAGTLALAAIVKLLGIL